MFFKKKKKKESKNFEYTIDTLILDEATSSDNSLRLNFIGGFMVLCERKGSSSTTKMILS